MKIEWFLSVLCSVGSILTILKRVLKRKTAWVYNSFYRNFHISFKADIFTQVLYSYQDGLGSNPSVVWPVDLQNWDAFCNKL